MLDGPGEGQLKRLDDGGLSLSVGTSQSDDVTVELLTDTLVTTEVVHFNSCNLDHICLLNFWHKVIRAPVYHHIAVHDDFHRRYHL